MAVEYQSCCIRLIGMYEKRWATNHTQRVAKTSRVNGDIAIAGGQQLDYKLESIMQRLLAHCGNHYTPPISKKVTPDMGTDGTDVRSVKRSRRN